MKSIFVIALLFTGTNLFSQSTESNPDVMPEFPGGSAEMMKYIQSHLKNPLLQKKGSDLHGCKTLIEFTVDSIGQVKNVYVMRSCIDCAGCDTEAVKLFEKMPTWKPGRKDNKPVAVKMGFPLFFNPK